ncbi:UDP-glucose 4-epimerase [compost metagenome]
MILVVGGAGYIGSHVVRELCNRGEQVVILDNLSTGHRWAIDSRAKFVEGDLGNKDDIERVFSCYDIMAVMQKH